MTDSRNPVILTRDHAETLDRFLMQRAESSLMLLSNSRSAGLEYHGGVLEGTYAASWYDDAIIGVAAHYWNGMVVLQAPGDAAGLFHAVTTASGRECTGIAGPRDQVERVLPEIHRMHPRPAMTGRNILFSLSLDRLVIPDLLHGDGVICRHPADDEIPAIIDLRCAFMREHLGPGLRQSHEREARDLVSTQHQRGNLWVLEINEKIVATTAFSAAIPELVQPGGVYALPGYRNRGYGRTVVAGSLTEARDRGVKKAILFTGADMPAAQKMYRALGFQPIGEYGLVIF
ncbi:MULTISPECIES: GNAT family N-acetyltransferase [unclassified Methanoregula]|uniref:GNAT family N-acetyltransferase n=1 Tax=unclassified Methanoregula TaxID=2649730 RepID=UPI0025D015C9|nr:MULTISPECIES: GNAT family N-acetyltransferase [unclassified Methanoregula]